MIVTETNADLFDERLHEFLGLHPPVGVALYLHPGPRGGNVVHEVFPLVRRAKVVAREHVSVRVDVTLGRQARFDIGFAPPPRAE